MASSSCPTAYFLSSSSSSLSGEHIHAVPRYSRTNVAPLRAALRSQPRNAPSRARPPRRSSAVESRSPPRRSPAVEYRSPPRRSQEARKKHWREGEFPGVSEGSRGTPIKNLKKKVDDKEMAKAWASTVTETLGERIQKKDWQGALEVNFPSP